MLRKVWEDIKVQNKLWAKYAVILKKCNIGKNFGKFS